MKKAEYITFFCSKGPTDVVLVAWSFHSCRTRRKFGLNTCGGFCSPDTNIAIQEILPISILLLIDEEET